jgi:hypothetical protein
MSIQVLYIKRITLLHTLKFLIFAAATRNSVQPTEAPERTGITRKRPNLRPEAKAVLTAWLSEHRHHPYPTEEEKDALVSEAGVTLAQVLN